MKHLTIQTKVMFLVIFSLVFTAVVSTLVVAYLMHKEEVTRLAGIQSIMTRDKVEALSDKVKIAYQVVDVVYQDLQNEPNKNDPEVIRAYQTRAKNAIKHLRFGTDGYFWINDFTPKMVMHPINAALDRKYISQSKDPNGKYFLNEMDKVAKEQGQGSVAYMWEKPGFSKPQDKISYVEAFVPWGWIIGTGVYADDIKALVAQEKQVLDDALKTMVVQNSIILLIVVIIFALISRTISKRLIGTRMQNLKHYVEDFSLYVTNKKNLVDYRLQDDTDDEIGSTVHLIDKTFKEYEKLRLDDCAWSAKC